MGEVFEDIMGEYITRLEEYAKTNNIDKTDVISHAAVFLSIYAKLYSKGERKSTE